MRDTSFRQSNRSQKHRLSSFFATKKWYLMALLVIIPAVLQQILSASMNLIDNIMVGQLSDRFINDLHPMNSRIFDIFNALGLWNDKGWWFSNGLQHFFHLNYTAGQIAVSGVTASNQIFIIIFAVMGGFINAVGIFGAQFYGAGRYSSLRQTVRMKLIFGFLIGTLVIILSYTIGYYLISYTTNPESAYNNFVTLCHNNNLTDSQINQLIQYLDYNKSFDSTGFLNFYNQFDGSQSQFVQIILKYYEFRSSVLATNQGLDYNKFIVFSYPLLGISTALVSAFRETKRGHIPLLLTGVSVLINLFLNVLFINGVPAWGIYGMGTDGSAISTLMSRVVQISLIVFFIIWKRYEFNPKVFKLFRIKKVLLKQVLLKAWPLMLNDLLFALGATFIIRLISQWSFDALGGSAIASTINTMFYTLYIGFGIAASVLIASRLGSDDLEGAKYNAKHLIRLGFFMALGFAGLLVLASFFLPIILFDATSEALRISQWMLRVDALVFASYTIMYVCIYAFKAGGLSFTVLLLDSTFTWVITIVVLLLQVNYASYDIIYIYGVARLTEIIKMGVSLFIYSKGKWVRNLAKTKPILPSTPIEIEYDEPEKQLPEEEVNIANF